MNSRENKDEDMKLMKAMFRDEWLEVRGTVKAITCFGGQEPSPVAMVS